MLCTQGYGSPFYFRENKEKRWAIYTLLDDKTEAYLQPASNGKEHLTVMVGYPKYIFKFHRVTRL